MQCPSPQLVVHEIEQFASQHGLIFRTNALGDRGCVLSPDEQHRYLIWQKWGSAPFLAHGLLNPSKADHETDDPTWGRGRSRAMDMRFGGSLFWNLFAYRATEPKDMMNAADPVGAHNDAVIDFIAPRCGATIAGWGARGGHLGRDMKVRRRLACIEPAIDLRHLGLTKDGQPRHPLYIAKAVVPQTWDYHP